MNKFEFLRYEPTPSEKHLGIATVNLYGKLIAKFKIVPTKDGTSFFPAAPSLKLGESYVSSLMLDSNIDKEELDALIKSRVRQLLNPSSTPPQYPQQSPPNPYQQQSFDFGEPPF